MRLDFYVQLQPRKFVADGDPPRVGEHVCEPPDPAGRLVVREVLRVVHVVEEVPDPVIVGRWVPRVARADVYLSPAWDEL